MSETGIQAEAIVQREWLAENLLFSAMMDVGDAMRQGRPVAQRKEIENDLVTEVDVRLDRFFHEKLHHYFPEDHILSEESPPPEGVDLSTSPGVWIVDPLDGTNNFVLGNPDVWISVAFVCCGRVEIAAVGQPATSRIFVATRAQMRPVLCISSVATPQHATIGHSWGYSMEEKWKTHRLLGKLIPGDFRQLRNNGTAVGMLTDVACGHLHGVVGSLPPWDVAAGGFLVECAGGNITHTDGAPWTPFRSDFVASNGHLHDLLLELVHRE